MLTYILLFIFAFGFSASAPTTTVAYEDTTPSFLVPNFVKDFISIPSSHNSSGKTTKSCTYWNLFVRGGLLYTPRHSSDSGSFFPLFENSIYFCSYFLTYF